MQQNFDGHQYITHLWTCMTSCQFHVAFSFVFLTQGCVQQSEIATHFSTIERIRQAVVMVRGHYTKLPQLVHVPI